MKNVIFIILQALLLISCAERQGNLAKPLYLSDKPIDNNEMICERLNTNAYITDNIVCSKAKRDGHVLYNTHNSIVIISSEDLWINKVYKKKLNPNEIRNVAFESCAIRMLKTRALRKKLYCDCATDFIENKLKNKVNVIGKDVIHLWGDKSKKDPSNNIVDVACMNNLDYEINYDELYNELYEHCITIDKKSKLVCDSDTKSILQMIGIDHRESIYKSELSILQD